MTKTTLESLREMIIDLESVNVSDLPLAIDALIARCNRAIIERAELLNDMDRACAVIADTFGDVAVDQSDETLTGWADEFADRYSPPPNRPVLKVVAK